MIGMIRMIASIMPGTISFMHGPTQSVAESWEAHWWGGASPNLPPALHAVLCMKLSVPVGQEDHHLDHPDHQPNHPACVPPPLFFNC